jgi:putative restriction endonuclease
MSESVIERELSIRLAAMDWLSTFGPEETFRYEQLAQFHFQGERVPLTDRGRGIRKPARLSAALSFSTVYTSPNGVPPYEDAEGRDGLLRYKIRGDDPRHPENVAMRAAHEQQLPLIWFVGVAAGLYLPRYPVYLVGEEQGQFVVALDQAQRNLAAAQSPDINEDDRRYAEAITQRRLHQPLFRARVLQAYESRCAMCHLRHASLLDASHILDDKHELGQPVVPNGLALCKIHHAGFDQNIIGVVLISRSASAKTSWRRSTARCSSTGSRRSRDNV